MLCLFLKYYKPWYVNVHLEKNVPKIVQIKKINKEGYKNN